MRNGECPKCGSHEIYGSLPPGGIGTGSIGVEYRFSRGLNKTYDTRTFLCAGCGYWENYLLDGAVIADIVTNSAGAGWVKVVPAGWLADPMQRHQHRYWDGAQWTAAVSDNGVRSNDPLAT